MSDTKDREIVVNRVIDAPRELVFDVFTQKEHIEKWWLPKDASTEEMAVKPGGVWRYRQAIRGTELGFKIEFVEIAKPNRLVWDYGMEAPNAPAMTRTVATFEEEDEKTKVTLQLVFATKADRDRAVKYGSLVGAMQALENLADYVAKL